VYEDKSESRRLIGGPERNAMEMQGEVCSFTETATDEPTLAIARRYERKETSTGLLDMR